MGRERVLKDEKTETLKYDTHNAMGRVAMYWGIPVFPLIFLLMGVAISFFVGIYLWGWWGIATPSPFIIALLALRIITERDDKAMRRFFFTRRRKRMNRKFGRHLLITPRNPKWRETNERRAIKKRILTGE
ncbi:hypothetical protein E2Y33_23350 [Salmonella enterica]|nr:hypothetical protein A6P56_29610 [Klebsiella pneumoniae]EAO2851319.1 hypothetical protein [Salmonella enterica]EEH8383333.1 hypothetical protein [Salmonella enterica subsp. enterica serovar Montevideo]EFY6275886.1 hypothetical protein [Shigella sonnei]EGC0981060.1 hypothetical protein [Escherichia coli]EHB7391029.1 hypothetical protein [Shigella flexneri]KJP45723.1 membrane protein [Enterobacter hormaechei subsp. xiangfangensis]